jgi:hypothetical protein
MNPDVMKAAVAALADATGHHCNLADVVALGAEGRRHLIASATARFTSGERRPVIVKATLLPDYDIDRADVFENHGLFRECVAASCLNRYYPQGSHGATLLALDPRRGVLVYDDLQATGERTTLVQPLLGDDAQAAEHALQQQAIALGRLHAATVGCRDAHHKVFQRLVGEARDPVSLGWPTLSDATEVAALLGGDVPRDELSEIEAKLCNPGPWLALRHGDPCPDNVLLVNGRARLIDFEFSRPGHALLDGLYWRMGFPNCWCAGRVPFDVATRVEAAYRNEIAVSIPDAADDLIYKRERAFVAAAWLINRLHLRLARSLEHDVQFRVGTLRGRVLFHLAAVSELTDEAGVLPAVNRLARQWLATLRVRWLDAQMLAPYPAFVPNK